MFRTILLFVCLAWAAVIQAAPVVIVVPPELYAAHAAADQAKAAAGKERGGAEADLQKALKLKSPAAIAAAKDAVAAAEAKCRVANEAADKANHALHMAPVDLTALALRIIHTPTLWRRPRPCWDRTKKDFRSTAVSGKVS